MRSINRRLLSFLAPVLAGLAYAQSAPALSIDVKFGGPSIGTLQSTSLADILAGITEELFADRNLAYAELTTPLGFGSVTSVGPIKSGGQFCIDSCRRILGDLFTHGGAKFGSYEMTWFFNSSLSHDAGFPPGTGGQTLEYVEMNAGSSASLATYTPLSQYGGKYGALITRKDLAGNTVFTALFNSRECAAEGASCSAFEVRNDFELEPSHPVDMLSMHFEGRILNIPEPATLALMGVGFAGLLIGRRSKSSRKPGQ